MLPSFSKRVPATAATSPGRSLHDRVNTYLMLRLGMAFHTRPIFLACLSRERPRMHGRPNLLLHMTLDDWLLRAAVLLSPHHRHFGSKLSVCFVDHCERQPGLLIHGI